MKDYSMLTSHVNVDEKAPEATAGPASVKSGLGSQSGTPREKPTTSHGLPSLELNHLPADKEEIDEGMQMRKHNDSDPAKFINFPIHYFSFK